MSGYKVFQCAPTDYILEPARYEKVTFVKSVARYELMMECNWVQSMQDVCNAMTQGDDVINVEDMRKRLFDDHYNATASAAKESTAADARAINVQWADLIATLLQQTSWTNVDGTSRVVDQTLVDAQMGHTPLVQNGAKGGFGARSADPDTLQLGAAGLSEVLATDPAYDQEKLGDLINNTNMYEILEKLIRHGCFVKVEDNDENTTNEKFTVNPLTKKDTTASNAGDATPTDELLLDNGDEIIFPINVKHIVGHTGLETDENVLGDSGAQFEVQIVFKLSGQSDDNTGAHSPAAGTLVNEDGDGEGEAVDAIPAHGGDNSNLVER